MHQHLLEEEELEVLEEMEVCAAARIRQKDLATLWATLCVNGQIVIIPAMKTLTTTIS